MAAVSPNWHLPVHSLRAHRCVPLLWVPLSLCLQSSEESRGAVSSTDGGPTSSIATTDEEVLSSHMCGFERRLFNAVVREPIVPMQALRGVFPAASEYYTEGAVLEMSVQMATSITGLVVSSWAKMEAHLGTSIAVVVLNCHDVDTHRAIGAVKAVFQRYFQDITCRCLVLDPTAETERELMSQHFFVAYTNTPVEDVSRYLLREVSLAMVHSANASLIALKSPNPRRDNNDVALAISNMTGITSTTTSTTASTTGDKHTEENSEGMNSQTGTSVTTSGETAPLKKHVLQSRFSKKKGDLLLQLGALDAALMAYGESLAYLDPLWASATLESFAAARYLQYAPLFNLSTTAVVFFASLESGETVWNTSHTTTLDQVENIVAKARTDQKKAFSLLRQNVSLTTHCKRLQREAEDPLFLHAENLRRHLASIRRDVNASPPNSDAANGEAAPIALDVAGRAARGSLRLLISVGYTELQLYLQEAIQQLRNCAGGITAARDRLVEIHFKMTELIAAEGDRQRFVEALTQLREVIQTLPDTAQRGLRGRIPSLCALSGCRRKSIFYALEAAVLQRQGHFYTEALRLLTRACRMAGITLTGLGLRTMEPFGEQGYVADRKGMTAPIHSTSVSENMATLNNSPEVAQVVNRVKKRRPRMQDIPLLMELLDVVTDAGAGSGPQGTVASLLLFEYYPFLRRENQQQLMNRIERNSAQPEPSVHSPPPLLSGMEVLALPPHLAPKNVPLSGAQFTFIDTGRLKMTLLTLNGKILSRGQVVWCVGTVGEVELTLFNPFRRDLQLMSIALRCRSVLNVDEEGNTVDGEIGHMVGPLAPSSYVATGVILTSASKRRLILQVQPNMQGYLIIDGVEIRLGQQSASSFFMPSPKPTIIPVLRQLPLIACTLGLSEVEIFGGQTQHFPLHLSNAGSVPIRHLQLTAHDESCQLDGCTGCKERPSTSALYVILDRRTFEKKNNFCLDPGGALTLRVTMIAPANIDDVIFGHILFRVTVELPHEPPVSPPDVPRAVPVYAVIPRRVQETYLRVFHVPSVAVASLRLSRDQRCVEITVKNKSLVHTTELLCSHIFFANMHDALVVAGAEYLIPPIDISRIPQGMREFPLPWIMRELPACRGVLRLDFSIVANAVVCTEPLEEAVVSVSASIHAEDPEMDEMAAVTEIFSTNTSELDTILIGQQKPKHHSHVKKHPSVEWRSSSATGQRNPIVVPAMRPVLLRISITAPWKRAVPIHIGLATESHLDADVLSGPVDATKLIGDDSKFGYEEEVEYFAFKTGDHVITIKLADSDGRELTHSVKLQVEHVH